MLAAERRDLLVTRLRRDGKLVARDLAAELGVSEESLRRDLRELAAAGLCQRVYGGALPVSPIMNTSHATRTGIAAESKQRVGARAAHLIAPGSVVFLSGDTTGLAVANALRPDLDAKVIAWSPLVAAALIDHPRVKVFMLGGWVDKYGATTSEMARAITADLCLLAPTGIHEKVGLTADDPDLGALQRICMSQAADTYVLGSADKIGSAGPYAIAGLSEMAGIVTDAPADHPTIQGLRQQGVNIIPATEPYED